MATAVADSVQCDVEQIQIGDKWSRISYGEVIGKDYRGIVVRNEKGVEWTLSNDIVEAEFVFAEQFEETEELTRTEMVQKIVSHARVAMTVHFKKKPEHKELVEAVTSLLDDEKAGKERPKPRTLSSLLKKATGGEDRTLIGRHYGVQDEFGRLQFTDMQATKFPYKQIDPRTVEWAIIENVKYVLKK